MDNVYIEEIVIESVRHLSNIQIPLGEVKKHLLLTGKNGSGKTSVLDAIAQYLNSVSTSQNIENAEKDLPIQQKELENAKQRNADESETHQIEEMVKFYQDNLLSEKQGVNLQMNLSLLKLYTLFQSGQYVLAYYKSDRVFRAVLPQHVEKVELRETYGITESARQDFVKYLLDLKVTEALALSAGKAEKAEAIKSWFDNFQQLLRRIFEDRSLQLVFDEDTFTFHIVEEGREPFDFNSLSSGYAAILDIVVDIILRMEKQSGKVFRFDMPGIVLIDEIETHLHLEMQKKILDLLTTIFPNIQFIISTHSPFVLNSLANVVIYDLERRLLVEDGLVDVPYEGIVEGYFGADTMSDILKKKYSRYRELVGKQMLSDEDFEEIARLELYLDEIPDYLALGITTEYQKLKMDFQCRGDV